MGHLIELKDLSRMLAERIDSLVPQILPAARMDGHEWRVGSLYNEPGQSLAIHRGGARKGVWCDFSSSDLRGDALDLVAQVCCGGDKARAIGWAKTWLGITSGDPKQYEKQLKAARKAEAAAQREAVRKLAQKKKIARRIWLNADPGLLNTPVDFYLQARGIDLRDLTRPPGAIRYDAECLCTENGAFYPAMVTAIVGPDGTQAAVHRTWLECGADGVWRKADLRESKKVLGPYMGGHIPLTRGASDTKLRNAPADDIIVIAEGIEDGLSIALACPEYRVLLAVSVSNFKNVRLPDRVGQIIIAADNDPETIVRDGIERPHPALEAVQAAVETFNRQGRDVYIARAPEGKDFNDLLRQGGKPHVHYQQKNTRGVNGQKG